MIGGILILTALLAANDRPAEAGQPAQVASTQGSYWDVYRTQQFAVAIPRNWQPQKANSPAMLLYLLREARDETGEPLKVGLTIERFPGNKDTLDEGVKQLIEHFRADKRWTPQGEIRDEPVSLADGTAARLVTLHARSQDGRRRALQYKLLALDKQRVGIAISAFLTTSAASKMTDPESKIARLLWAHVTSLTLDPAKMNDAALRAAYTSHESATSQPATQPAR